jgi:hypothetical protein
VESTPDPVSSRSCVRPPGWPSRPLTRDATEEDPASAGSFFWHRNRAPGDRSRPARGAKAMWRSSRPREFHPEPLTGPDVSLSTHPARATNLKTTAFRPNMRAPPVASWPNSYVGDPPPSLHDHYNRFITTTGRSVPDRCIGTFGLMGSPLVPFPLTPPIKFSSSI